MSHAHTALGLVCGDRNNDYGNPSPDFKRIALVWSGIIGEKLMTPITEIEVALMMTGLKLVRHAHKPKDDNLVDAIGYLTCAEWIETGVKPHDLTTNALHARIAELEAMVESVACGERLKCPACSKLMPCDCEHKPAPEFNRDE